MENAAKRSRSSKPKVRTGCITCKIRRVKCDEVRPQCLRCVSTGRKCDGYTFSASLSPAGMASARESRALEFFYHNTAPQLSGCFGSSFWKACIQQLALTEPSVRYTIIAIGVLHEAKLAGLDSTTTSSLPGGASIASALQFYNKAINAITKKASADTDALPVVIVTCIAFICFEGLMGRIDTALNHIKSGIGLLQSHREAHGAPNGPWGHSYSSFQSSFLETELAPTLSSVNMSIREYTQNYIHLSLNPLDDIGIPILRDEFTSLAEAGVGLLDLNNAGLKLFRVSMGIYRTDENNTRTSIFMHRLRHAIILWGINFEYLIERRQGCWTDEEKREIDSLRITWLTMKVGMHVGPGTEDEWDGHLSDFEEIIRITESLIPDGHVMDHMKGIPRAFSFETSLIDPLTLVSFKCRWPILRRKALDLLLRVPRREYFFDSMHTYVVLSRIMEIEEASLNLPPGVLPTGNILPPTSACIHYFFMSPQPVAGDNLFEITFLIQKSDTDTDTDAELSFHTEHKDYIRLPMPAGSEGTSPRLRQVIYSTDDGFYNHS